MKTNCFFLRQTRRVITGLFVLAMLALTLFTLTSSAFAYKNPIDKQIHEDQEATRYWQQHGNGAMAATCANSSAALEGIDRAAHGDTPTQPGDGCAHRPGH